MPQYRTTKGTPVSISTRTNECPVSLITPQSRELVQIYFRSKILHEAGVAPLGAEDLPIKVADAFVVIATEANIVEGAINEIEHFDAKHGSKTNDV